MSWILPIIPVMASTLAARFEALFWYVTIVTGISALLVYGAILYFCVAFRRSEANTQTPRILGSARLEIAWTIIPTIIFFTFFAWGAIVYRYAMQPPRDAEEIFVIGKQWMWKAQYTPREGELYAPRIIIGGNPANMDEADRKKIGRLVLPVNKSVKITFTSEDVIHDFGVPAFRSKIDVLPLRYSTSWYHPTEIGEYHIFCDQYCGTWHSLMVGKIAVVSQEDYTAFRDGLLSLQGTENPAEGTAAADGRQLFLKLQCITCHTAKPDGRAPVLEGLYGTRVPLAGHGGIIADESYIQESILNPRAKLVEGWQAIMPSYEGQVTATELRALINYIKSLKRGTTPDRTDYNQPPVGAPTKRPPEGSGSEVKKP
ncbi:MAG TPA: cytochrome c oxidase subunit II [Gemmata sp.]|nr:cytochrome c oxidase subunit II [Gemmata sp.]